MTATDIYTYIYIYIYIYVYVYIYIHTHIYIYIIYIIYACCDKDDGGNSGEMLLRRYLHGQEHGVLATR